MTKPKNQKNEGPVDFNMEYDALEYLLISIIDANPDTGKERRLRLRDAYESLTGVRIERVDEPDSDISKAMFEYARLEDENFRNQDLPEVGGPTVETPDDEETFREK